MGRNLAVAAAMILITAAPSKADDQKEIDRLQGTWMVVAVAAEGKDQSKEIQSKDRWVFAGSKTTLYNRSRAPEFDVKIDPGKEPKALDLSIVDETKKEVTLLCIYSLEKDRMRLAYAMPGVPRPTAFTTKKDSKYLVFLLQRVRPGEKSDRDKMLDAKHAAEDLQKKNQLAEAAVQFEQAIQLARELEGAKSVDVGTLAESLAEAYKSQGQLAKAAPLYEESMTVAEEVVGPESRIIGDLADTLGGVLLELGRYPRAEEVFQRSLRISEIREGKDSVDLAVPLQHLAQLYLATGDFKQAEALFRRAVRIFEDHYGADDPRTMIVTSNLGVFYRTKGELQKAEPLFAKAIEILDEYGKDQSDLAAVLNNQALVYYMMGQRPKSVEMYERCRKILESLHGENHPDVAKCLSNLAMVQIEANDLKDAEKNLLRAIDIFEKAYGRDNAWAGRPLQNLSMLYLREGEFAKSVDCGIRSKQILERQLGPDNVDVALALNNLATDYLLLDKFDEAEQVLKHSIEIFQRKLGNDAAVVAQCFDNLSIACSNQQRWKDAFDAADQARRIIRRHVQNVLPLLPEHEQLVFLNSRVRPEYEKALSLAWSRRADPAIAERSAGWLLNGSALTQEVLARAMQLARDADSPAQKLQLGELAAVRRQLATLSLAGEASSAAGTKHQELADREQRLERQIADAAGPSFHGDPWIELDAVRKRLPADAVLIQLARFEVFPPDVKDWGKNQPPRYAAWIVPPLGKGPVKIIDLGEAEPIDDAVQEARSAIASTSGQIARSSERDAVKQLEGPMKALAGRILDPLRDSIDGFPRWVLSPDASLWLVPWCALPIGEGRYAIEKHTISYVLSGRSLVAPAATAGATAPLVMAAPDYDLVTHAAGGPRPAVPPDVTRRHWPDLSGTAREAEAIVPLLTQYTHAKPQVFLKQYAREGKFKQCSSPRVVLFSTHAFFDEDRTDPATVASRGEAFVDLGAMSWTRLKSKPATDQGQEPLENPLVHCGLVLAGANHAAEAADGEENGILTGLEIVGTDLRGTEMVVLSACETGLGRVHKGEGVAGLRQAFQLAGARSVVATLWKIPDQQTADLMIDFFTQLASQDDEASALRQAQQDQIQSRRKAYGAAHPFYWAAFTATGWRAAAAENRDDGKPGLPR